MALYFHNTFVLAADYLKISNRHSSPQSFWRAKKNGVIKPVAIGGLQFMDAFPAEVAMLYDTVGLNSFATVPPDHNVAGLALLSSISKAVGVNEAKVMVWAISQRMDVYWIAGKLFGDLQVASRLAAEEKAHIAVAQKLKPKRRVRRRDR